MAQTAFTTQTTLGTTLASIYANPAATITQIGSILLHNTNTTNETIEINYVLNASGALGTAAASNRIMRVVLVPDESLEITQKFPWTLSATNDAFFAKTTTASKVNATISGVKTT